MSIYGCDGGQLCGMSIYGCGNTDAVGDGNHNGRGDIDGDKNKLN